MKKFFELFTNDNGRASTTGFIQFISVVTMRPISICILRFSAAGRQRQKAQ